MLDSMPRRAKLGRRGGWVTRLGSLFLLNLVLVVLRPPTLPAVEQRLTPEQEGIARSIDAKLIAPCCFRGTLAEHDSPIATEMRGEVRDLLVKGAAEQEILDHFLEKYGERILAAPRAQGFNLLAWVMPIVGVAFGSTLILLFLRRASKPESAHQAGVVEEGGRAAQFDESVEIRFREELDRFER